LSLRKHSKRKELRAGKTPPLQLLFACGRRESPRSTKFNSIINYNEEIFKMQKGKQLLVTEEGLKKLEEELEYLKTTKRKEVVETIKVALSFGDLSENSEYDEAKNEQAKVEVRIMELEELLKNIKVIDDSEVNTDVVNVGSKVTVLNMNLNKEIVYSIVGSTEADPFNMKISDESPIGKALIGAEKDSVIEYETPNGKFSLKIIEISK
jgi:transcription elongation factor GreA